MSSSSDCVDGALPGGLSRTSYFDGMVLTQADVGNEQRFWRIKRRLTNRALGQGVVWGLKLSYKNGLFHVTPGYGLDCCGNDLVVEAPTDARWRDLFAANPDLAKQLSQLGESELLDVAIQLQYVECPEEPRAVHKNACSSDPTGCQTSRVRETTRLVALLPFVDDPGALGKFGAGLQALEDAAQGKQPLQGNVFPGTVRSFQTFSQKATRAAAATATKAPAAAKAEAAPAAVAGARLQPELLKTQLFPIALNVRIGNVEKVVAATIDNSNNQNGNLGFFSNFGAEAVVSYPTPGNDATQPELVTFEIRPNPGQVLTTGQVYATAGDYWQPVVTLQPPFQLAMEWSYQLPLTGPEGWNSDGIRSTYSYVNAQGNFEYGALFGGDRTSQQFQLNATIITTPLITSGNQPSTPSQMQVLIQINGWIQFGQGGDAKETARPLASLPNAPASKLPPRPVPKLPATPPPAFAAARKVAAAAAPSKIPIGHTQANCFDALTPGALFLDGKPDQAVDPKGLILAAFYVYLQQMLGSTNPSDIDWDGQRSMASWIYLSAWRLLFGANPASPDPDAGDRAALAQLLHSLLQDWCDSFMYAGPVCPDDGSHGVVLGTARVDASGRVQDFSPFVGRRYVLTGPLLNHWASQIGVAPIDVIAGRFARTLCCLAGGDAQELPAMTPSPSQTLVYESLRWGYPGEIAPTNFPPNGVLLTDGAYLVYGAPGDSDDQRAQFSVEPVRTDTLSWPKFVAKLVEVLSRGKSPDVRNGYICFRCSGAGPAGQVSLYVLATDEEAKEAIGRRHHLRELVEEALEDLLEIMLWTSASPLNASFNLLPPLARRPLIDYAVELLDVLGVSQLPGSQPLADTLIDAGLDTIGKLLGRDAEAVADELDHPDDATLTTIYQQANQVLLGIAQSLLQALASWQSINGGNVFTRQSLWDWNFLNPLEQQIRNSLSPFLSPLPTVDYPNQILSSVARTIRE